MSIIVHCTSCQAKNRITQISKGKAVCGRCKTPLPQPGFGRPAVLTDQDFDGLVAGSAEPVMVDFWAAWCGPCKMMAPVLEQLAGKQQKILLAKLDTEAHQQTAARFGIQSIPTLILFVNGREAKRITGAMPLPALERELLPWL